MSTHTCHWPGCNTEVPPKMWGCRGHWFRLPLDLRQRVWAAYRDGQEETKTPSVGYVIVAREVQAWCRQWIKDHPEADKQRPKAQLELPL